MQGNQIRAFMAKSPFKQRWVLDFGSKIKIIRFGPGSFLGGSCSDTHKNPVLSRGPNPDSCRHSLAMPEKMTKVRMRTNGPISSHLHKNSFSHYFSEGCGSRSGRIRVFYLNSDLGFKSKGRIRSGNQYSIFF